MASSSLMVNVLNCYGAFQDINDTPKWPMAFLFTQTPMSGWCCPKKRQPFGHWTTHCTSWTTVSQTRYRHLLLMELLTVNVVFPRGQLSRTDPYPTQNSAKIRKRLCFIENDFWVDDFHKFDISGLAVSTVAGPSLIAVPLEIQLGHRGPPSGFRAEGLYDNK